MQGWGGGGRAEMGNGCRVGGAGGGAVCVWGGGGGGSHGA